MGFGIAEGEEGRAGRKARVSAAAVPSRVESRGETVAPLCRKAGRCDGDAKEDAARGMIGKGEARWNDAGQKYRRHGAAARARTPREKNPLSAGMKSGAPKRHPNPIESSPMNPARAKGLAKHPFACVSAL